MPNWQRVFNEPALNCEVVDRNMFKGVQCICEKLRHFRTSDAIAGTCSEIAIYLAKQLAT